METAADKATRIGRTAAVAAAMLSGGLLVALAAVPLAKPAEAAFPGENGLIAFASNRATGEGVDNPEGDFEIFTMNPDGTDLTQLTHNAAFDFDPDWSAGGEKMAFESDRDRFSNIFTMNADGTEQTNITNDPSINRSPAYAPDGERVAFESNRTAGEGVDNPERDGEIFVQSTDGTGLEQLTTNTALRDAAPDWSPDGKKIAFITTRDFGFEIYTMNADGSKQMNRSQDFGFEGDPSWSPDGGRIAYSTSRDGGTEVYRMRSDGSAQKRLTDNGVPTDSGPVFSPDGRQIAFQSNRDGNFEIYKMRTDGKGPVNLTNDPAGDFTPDWQPLEKRR